MDNFSFGRVRSAATMTAYAPPMIIWLTPAEDLQMQADLDALPILSAELDTHYRALLAKGSVNPDDRMQRYPIEPGVLDLADRRSKDGDTEADVEADTARYEGERRVGILPTLVGWVDLAAGQMAGVMAHHRPPVRLPVDPATGLRRRWVTKWAGVPFALPQLASEPSVTTETAWLADHLDWIRGEKWIAELADELRRMVADLEHHIGPVDVAADRRACITAKQAATTFQVPLATIYRWANDGLLTDVGRLNEEREVANARKLGLIARGPRVFIAHEIKHLAEQNTPRRRR